MTAVCMVVQNHYDTDPRVRRKAEALVAAGYVVDVLALRGGTGRTRYTLNGVNVETVDLGKKRAGLVRYVFEYVAFLVWAFARLSVRMAQRRYAVIDVNTLPDFLVFAGVVARRMGAKLLLDMHEITPEFFSSKYGIADGAWQIRALKRAEKASFDFADHVLTIHEPMQDLLARRGLPMAKSTVVMNAVDEAAFRRGRTSTTVRPPTSARFVMMYHGTLTGIYGVDLVIEALGLAHAKMPGAELWILGDGPARPDLERAARRHDVTSRVRFFGSVPPADVMGWVEQCDVGVLAMRHDPFLHLAFPNKLSEYVVLGKPVVIPRLATIRHYFSENALLYFEPDDAADLARQLVAACGDEHLRARRAAQAAAEYAPLRWDVMKERYLRVVTTMAGRHEPASASAFAASRAETSQT